MREPSQLPPYVSASEHLADHQTRMLLHVKFQILVHWRRLVDSSGKLDDLFVSIDEMLELTGARGLATNPPGGLADQDVKETLAHLRGEITRIETQINARLAAADGCVRFPIEDLAALFRLTAGEVDVVVLLALIGTDIDFARLCTFAWADFTRKQPDVAFVVEVLSRPFERHTDVVAALAESSTLHRLGLVHMTDSDDWRPETPPIFRRLSLARSIADGILTGGIEMRVQTPRFCRPLAQLADLDALFLPADVVKESKRLTARAMTRGALEPLIVHVIGPSSVGRTTLIGALAKSLGRAVWIVHVASILDTPEGEIEQEVVGILRDATMANAVVVLDLDTVHVDEKSSRGRSAIFALGRALARAKPTLFAKSVSPTAWLASVARIETLSLPHTSPTDQLRAWRGAFGSGIVLGNRSLSLDYLANRFNLPAGLIVSISREARQLAQPSRSESDGVSLDEAALMRVARQHVNTRLGALATPQHTDLGWDDLVLGDKAMGKLREIEESLRHHHQVLDEWGFGRIAGSRRGTTILFSGAPGTGKTLCGTILGKMLGRDVFRIDLSQVVDKFVGETEKNLGRIFDESEYSQVLLLFDEADSLFGSRTSMSSSHDRYNNLQINFLLQRIESFEGVCVLTTNFEENIDPAFKRRIRYQVHFDVPDENTRERLWRTMVPGQFSDGVRWRILAREFEFAGGHIRNAVLRAAFDAASRGEVLGHVHFVRAARAEAQQMGLLVRE